VLLPVLPVTVMERPWLTGTWEFRRATEVGAHTMVAVEELLYLGYIKIGFDPRYRTWLMGRPC
jgi:hypothetical protein